MRWLAAVALVACASDTLHVEPSMLATAALVTYDIEDTFLHANEPTSTWGGYKGVYFGEGNQWRPLVRLSAPPERTVTGARFFFYVGGFHRGGPTERLLTAFRVADGNRWVEGSGDDAVGDNTIYAGSGSTWAGPWTGLPGISAPDIDFIVEAEAPTALVTQGWNVLDIPPEWTRSPNGFVLFDSSGPGHGWFWSSEARTAFDGPADAELPYFELEVAQ